MGRQSTITQRQRLETMSRWRGKEKDIPSARLHCGFYFTDLLDMMLHEIRKEKKNEKH